MSVRPSMMDATVPVATAASLHSELGAAFGAPALPAWVCACAAGAALKAAATTPTKNPLPMANETPPPATIPPRKRPNAARVGRNATDALYLPLGAEVDCLRATKAIGLG
jgi:hypothetical protein